MMAELRIEMSVTKRAKISFTRLWLCYVTNINTHISTFFYAQVFEKYAKLTPHFENCSSFRLDAWGGGGEDGLHT
jgi:hypothetical protein